VVRLPDFGFRGPGFNSRSYQIFWEVMGLERGPLGPCEDKWGANCRKKYRLWSRKRRLMVVGIRCGDHARPLYSQKSALAPPAAAVNWSVQLLLFYLLCQQKWTFHLEERSLLGCDAVWLLLERTFRRNVSPPPSGRKNQRARNSFYLDEGGDRSLRNVGSHKSHTASHPRRRHSSVF
jgi:hypothetical protein